MKPETIMDMLPRYKRVRVEIEKFLSTMVPGSLIPSEGELMKKFSVSRVTTRKALKDLRMEGVLESFKGKGTFLAKVPRRSWLHGKRHRLLGVLLPSLLSPDVARIYTGIEVEAEKEGFRIHLSHNDGEPRKQIRRLSEMADSEVSGILIYPNAGVTEEKDFLDLLGELQKRKRKMIFLDRYVPGFEFPSVMTDNVRGMHQASSHLLRHGFCKPALIGFWKRNTVHLDRRKGFFSALAASKIDAASALEAEVGIDEFDKRAFEIVTEWIANERKCFDSIVCMADSIAHGAFMALRNSRLRVPEDVGLIGYDNEDSGLYRALGLKLTSVQQPLAEIGKVAVQKMIRMLEPKHGEDVGLHTVLKPKLVVRTSCREK